MTKEEATKLPTKLETIHLKVFIHCQGCRRKVKKIITSVDGVESVDIDSGLGKVTVVGFVDSKTLVQKLQKAKKFAEPWPNASPFASLKGGNLPNLVKNSGNGNSASGNNTIPSNINNHHNSNHNNKGKTNNSNNDNNNQKNSAMAKGEKGLETTRLGVEGEQQGGNIRGKNKGVEDISFGVNAGAAGNMKALNSAAGLGGTGKKGDIELNTMLDFTTAMDKPGMMMSAPIMARHVASRSNTTTGSAAAYGQSSYSSTGESSSSHFLQSTEDATHLFSDENANNCHIM